MIELAKRAVKAKGWRWLPGMLALDTGLRLDEMTDDWEAELPDLNDPATLGCLLALVREAWDMPRITTFCADGWWSVHSPILKIGFPFRDKKASSEAAALVKTLEAAP